VIALFGIVLGIVGMTCIGVATLRKISRTGAWTKWGLARYRNTSPEVSLLSVGWALVLVGMAVLLIAGRLHL
jgi:hypothetical protein